jgi:predicted SnoaL-like aldol condensation-catalyzing enzyme
MKTGVNISVAGGQTYGVAYAFVEHNPRIEGGRDGLVKFIKMLPRPASDDIGPEMKNPPAYIVAEGDLVTFIFKERASDPNDKTKTYDRFTFDSFGSEMEKSSSTGTAQQNSCAGGCYCRHPVSVRWKKERGARQSSWRKFARQFGGKALAR